MNYVFKAAAIGGAMLLSACGGGSDSDVDRDDPTTGVPPVTEPPSLISPDEEVLRLFSDTSGDIADVLAAGGPALVAREVSEATWREDYAGTGSYRIVDSQFSVQADGNDLLVTIGEEGGAQYVYRIVNAASITDDFVTIDTPGGDYFDLFIGGGGTIADLFNSGLGSGYARRMGLYYRPTGADFGYESRSVVGTETRDSVISELTALGATATYRGFAGISIRNADAGWPTFNGNIGADLDMVANFGAGTVSGTMSNLQVELREGPTVTDNFSPAGTVRLDDAAILKNAFSGGMTPDATLQADNATVAGFVDSGTYSGAFYGPNAEEIGGTMTFDATLGTDRFLGIGNFTAD